MRARVHAQGPADGTKDADKAFHSAAIIFGKTRRCCPECHAIPCDEAAYFAFRLKIRRGERPASSRRYVEQALRNTDKAFHSPAIIFGAKRDGAAPSVMRYPAVKPYTSPSA
jgi:hypothetical protein